MTQTIDSTGRTCTKCNTYKVWSNFSPRKESKTGHRPECRECTNKHYARRNRQSAYKRKFGITVDQYDLMFSEQNGKCAICGTTEPGRDDKNFAVDHDHHTGKVRGLLCMNCNRGIGLLNDDISNLTNAINYLNNHQ